MRNAVRLFVLFSLSLTAIPAAAADGEILITQSKALQGGITPNDAAGFPVTITKPGVYRLASTLEPPADRNGISVQANNVTIDFNGFALIGNHGTNLSQIGIVAPVSFLTIRNGTISGFGSYGIGSNATHISTNYWLVEGMTITGNSDGIHHNGGSSRFSNNMISGNRGSGLLLRNIGENYVTGNVIERNAQAGVDIQDGIVLNNIIRNNHPGIRVNDLVSIGNNVLENDEQIQDNHTATVVFPNGCNPACP